ncbi:MAG: hypothetical protein QXO21_06370 [Candidatus Anstonellales archaeon]
MTNSIKKKNVYKHTIDLQKINIKNASPREFATLIERIPYQFNFSTGELPEALIKSYKWIWGSGRCRLSKMGKDVPYRGRHMKVY